MNELNGSTPPSASAPLLEVEGLVVRYGGQKNTRKAKKSQSPVDTTAVSEPDPPNGAIEAVKGIDFQIFPGELVALIGANGAGKTTTMLAITRGLPLHAGTVRYQGLSSQNTSTHELAAAGLVLVPEGRGTFTGLTVQENLEVGGHLSSRHQRQIDIEEAFTQFPLLKKRRKERAGMLSGGEQQILVLARALMRHPKLLLLDEPSMGLAPLWANLIFDAILSLAKRGTTVFLVEQNAQRTLEVVDRAYVMESGRITLSGSSEELLNSPAVQAAYLGR